MKLPKITTSELSAAQTEAFDWARIKLDPRKPAGPPPSNAITMMDAMEKLGLTDFKARNYLNAKVQSGEMETGLFSSRGAPGKARYYWWKKKPEGSSNQSKPKSARGKKSGT